MIFALVLFFDQETVRDRCIQLAAKLKLSAFSSPFETEALKKPIQVALALYFIFQLGFPLRHHLIEGDVMETSEGHYFAWRMKLSTYVIYELMLFAKDPNTGEMR